MGGDDPMKRATYLFILIFAIFSWRIGGAEENWYFLVDPELREVYEYFEGMSLEAAIDELLREGYFEGPGCGGVAVGFRTLFIGMENILEIRIRNSAAIQVANLEFQFTCTADLDSFFVPDYGTITPHNGPQNMIKIHPEAFASDSIWATSASFFDYPHRLLLSGYVGEGEYMHTLPPHNSYVTLYSMKIYIPFDMSLLGEVIIIDNVNVDPGCDWYFEEVGPPIHKYSPLFQENPNISMYEPSACADTFIISIDPDRLSKKDLKKTKLIGKAALRDDYDFMRQFHKAVDRDSVKRIENPGEYYGLIYRNGIRYISARMEFEGPDEDLLNLGVNIYPFMPMGFPLIVDIPVANMPQVCQLEGVKSIYPVDRGYPKLE